MLCYIASINRLLAALREAKATGSVVIDDSMRKDLLWIVDFLPKYNGVDIITKPPCASHELVIDACLSGCGGHFGALWYHSTFPAYIIKQDISISQLEMLISCCCNQI